MANHSGRNEVARRRQRLRAVFDSLNGAAIGPELTSHFARYLCVLVSGYAEQSVKELIAHYSRTKSQARIQRYVGAQLKRVRNIDQEKLRQLLQSFDPKWWDDLLRDYADELAAFDSVATVRNGVSHGTDVGITMATVRQYFDQVSVVLDALSDVLDPA
ncbi:hypothetical protein LJR027_000224 [Terrabacter sp. LjRoot27]|uniref:HEPN domain-containing protein n=1 Tax=Terrabacter sp. LjRoot27 TaxID=3342306 RepID=UPI003ECE9798